MNMIKKILLAMSYLVLMHSAHATILNYGAGNISDTVNTAGWKCSVDHGNWIFNAGVVLPAVSSCSPIGTPTQIYPHRVAPANTKPTMTHRWWGSISFLGEMTVGDSNKSAYITPDPMTARITNMGVRIMGIPNGIKTASTGNEYTYQIPDPFSEVFDGIAIGNSAYSNLTANLKDYSDASVTVQWNSGATAVMEATFVHGSPYAYFTALQGNLVVRTKSPDGGEKGVFYQAGNSLGIWTDVAGDRNSFLITGHDATTFTNPNSASIGVNNGTKRLTVTLLPQGAGTPSTAMIQAFEQYAAQRVDKVNINYTVDRSANKVTITHQYQFAGVPVTTMVGMLPLHWKNSTQAVTSYKVRSARGVTKFATTNGFSYTIPFVGVLPTLPDGIGDYNITQLRALVTEFVSQGSANWNTAPDTYWAGKNYGKVAELAAIARSIGMTTEADQLVNWLKGELQDWFHANTTGSLDTTKYFMYDSNWNTLLGFEESFGAQQQLNDHHFHYGYFVRAAAEVCRVDASWCSATNYGPMIELLIRDYAADRNDTMFPYLRNFDPAYGFSWASGHANFVLGNNNESTSEAANAYGAMVLYGMITGNTAITERGMYLHASSTAAYWEYWNNYDRFRGLTGDYDNFDPSYTKMTTSIIWGNGHVFGTWFSGAYAHILGIQGLPLSPLVFHIGQHADYLANYVTLGMSGSGESTNGKPSGLSNGLWRDVWWNIWAMTNGQAAADDLASYGFNYTPEEGETKAHTYHWIYTLKQLGALATGTGALTANSPSAVAFNKAGVMTYMAYNFSCTPQTVSYSDGTSFSVPVKGFAFKRGAQAVVSTSAGCSGTSSSAASSVAASSIAPSSVPASSIAASSVPASSVPASSRPASSVAASSVAPSSAAPSSVAASSVAASSSVASGNGYTVLSATSIRFYVNNAPWADIHFTISGGAQQNIRMTVSGSNNTYDVTGLTSGAVVNYFFTVGIAAGGAVDTTWASVTCCSGATSSAAPSSVAASSVAPSSVPASSKPASSVAPSSVAASSAPASSKPASSVAASSVPASSVAASSKPASSAAASSVAGCTTAAFINGTTYATGAKVKNVGYEYTCTVGGWCSMGGAYEPGVGWAWANAWTQGGVCN